MNKINLEVNIEEIQELKELLKHHQYLTEQLCENLSEIEQKVLEVNIAFNGDANKKITAPQV